MVLVVIGHVERFAEGREEVELDRQERHAVEAHAAALGHDHGEIALGLVVDAALGVALEEVAQLGAAGGDDGELVLGRDLVEARDGDALDLELAALCREIVHPAMALQAQIDREEIVLEPSGRGQQAVVLGRAEGQMHALALGRARFPMVEAELALEFERGVEARGRAGRPALVQPLIGSAVGIERDLVAGLEQAVGREQPGLTRADNGDIAHSPLPDRAPAAVPYGRPFKVDKS